MTRFCTHAEWRSSSCPSRPISTHRLIGFCGEHEGFCGEQSFPGYHFNHPSPPPPPTDNSAAGAVHRHQGARNREWKSSRDWIKFVAENKSPSYQLSRITKVISLNPRITIIDSIKVSLWVEQNWIFCPSGLLYYKLDLGTCSTQWIRRNQLSVM